MRIFASRIIPRNNLDHKQVYTHLLQTYGRHPAVWFGFVAETIRTLAHRVYVPIIAAQMAIHLAAHDSTSATQQAFLFLFVYVAGAVVGVAGELIATFSEDYTYQALTLAYHQKLTGKDMTFYRDNQTGYLVGLFRQYLDSTMQLVRLLRSDITKAVVTLIAPVIVLFVVNRLLGLIACGIIVVQIMYVVWASSKANDHRKRSHEIYRKVTGEVSDQITNIVAFKSGGLEKRAFTKIRTLAKEETKTFWLRRKTIMLLDLPRELVTAIGVTLAFLAVLASASDNPASIGLILLTIAYMFQIVRSVSELPNLITQHDDWVTKLHPTLRYLGIEHETVKDPVRPKRLRITKGAIRINHMHFSYPAYGKIDQHIPVFKDLNLTIKGGEHVGIVGMSGAGKSTLASLIMRFDDVTSGAITIDGTDIRRVRQTDLHRNIAYVPQEPLLFHSTISDNIAYFSDKATNQTIIKAAKAAHAHEFITKLPNGYDTIVGERGVKLSGGQKQRVVIARAILKNAPLMIFDEATSALDTESEKMIQRALPTIIGTHTAIVIAHRLSTIAGLDRILVMHNGEIVESGTHDELLALNGRYDSLWQKQIAGEKSIRG